MRSSNRMEITWKMRIRGGALPPEVIAEIRRGHLLSNKITEIYKASDEQLASLYETAAEVTAAQEACTAASQAAAELAAEIKRRKAAARSAAPDPVLAARYAAAVETRKAAAARLKAARKAVRESSADILAGFRAAEKDKVKALYQVSGSGELYQDDTTGAGHGLYWSSFNAIAARRKKAAARVIDMRKKNQPAELHYRRWDGSGTIDVQLPRPLGGRVTVTFTTAGKPGEDPEPGSVTAAVTPAGGAGTVSAAECTVTRVKGSTPGEWQWTVTAVNRGEDSTRILLTADPSLLLDSGAAITSGPDVTAADAEITTGTPAAPPGEPDAVPAPPWSWECDLAGAGPLRSPQRISDPGNPWRQQLLLLHGYPGSTERWQQKRAALRFRFRAARPGIRCRHDLDPFPVMAAATAIPEPYRSGTVIRQRFPEPSVTECETCGAAWAIVPLTFHRPLPPDCEITGLEITCRREGGAVTASAQLILSVPVPVPPAAGYTAAVHCGWRALDDGSLRVAVITGVTSPPPPLHWAVPAARGRPASRHPVIRSHEGWHEVIIPAAARDLLGKAASLSAIRSRCQDEARKALTAYLAAYPASKETVDPDGTAALWRSPARFARALKALRGLEEQLRAQDATAPAAGEDLRLRDTTLAAAVLDEYVATDRHLGTFWEASLRLRYQRWREDTWRKIAAWVTSGAAEISVDAWTMRRHRPGPGEEETRQAQIARANAAAAGPAELRSSVEAAARIRGIPVMKPPAGIAGEHHGCPASEPGTLGHDERREAVTVTCPACSRQVDQDANTARGMLLAARGILPGSSRS
jgi:hypothetical protein